MTSARLPRLIICGAKYEGPQTGGIVFGPFLTQTQLTQRERVRRYIEHVTCLLCALASCGNSLTETRWGQQLAFCSGEGGLKISCKIWLPTIRRALRLMRAK